MSSLTIAGTAYRCRPWPVPSIQPAIAWVQNSAGEWTGSDRGAAQDIYSAEVTFTDTDAQIDSLKTILNANREGLTLSALQAEVFAPNVNHTGSISCSVVDFGVREHVQWAGPSNNVQSLAVTFQALSPPLLTTTPSLATLRLQTGYSGDHSWTAGRNFSLDQTAAYSDHRSDVGLFRGRFQQTRAEAQAILRYLLVTARAASFTLPTFSGVTYPFGVSRGTGPFTCRVPKFGVSRKNLNRWILDIEFAESP
jgi:hypothetical protein